MVEKCSSNQYIKLTVGQLTFLLRPTYLPRDKIHIKFIFFTRKLRINHETFKLYINSYSTGTSSHAAAVTMLILTAAEVKDKTIYAFKKYTRRPRYDRG